jgi:hypothetical protein
MNFHSIYLIFLGYGVGGADLGNCWAWNNKGNLDNRARDGVVALSMASGYFYPSHRPSI